MPEEKSERKGFVSAHLPPHGRRFGLRVAGSEQQLRLVRLQHPRGFVAGRPPPETPFGQSLGRQPKPLAIELEDPDGGSTAAAEDKQVAGKRIGVELLPAQLSDSINTLPAIDGFNRNQNADLWCDLDHAAASHKLRVKLAKSAAVAPIQ
jgi:hypothetical protein